MQVNIHRGSKRVIFQKYKYKDTKSKNPSTNILWQ